ncbi:MAG: hypothetical protein LUO79_07810 [Methanomassiliicoccales archaeon]|nr:hypothetical protein [Methanomassiliicoccales archaeon]
MSLWVAVLQSDGDLPLGARANMFIETEKWFDARAYALCNLGEDAVVELSYLPLEPDIELSWRGSDFRETGGRALWMRERGKEWVKT